MKEFKIFENTKHEYDIFVEDTDNGTEYSLYYSSAGHWTYPNKLIISAVDTGNEIKLSEKMGKTIDYSDFAEISLLFNFILKYDKQMGPPNYQVIPVNETAFSI
jgi:hypothetical protein